MKHKEKTKDQLIDELEKLRHRIVELGEKEIERKRAQEALKESEEKFKNIYESVAEDLIFLDRTGRIIDVNEQAVKIYAGTREGLLGKHFTKVGVVFFKDIPVLLKKFASILTGNKPTICIRIKNKEGQDVDLECSGAVIKKDNRPAFVNVIVRDITERKKAEEALKESERHYRGLYESSLDGIVSADLDGNFLECNQAFADMLGYTKEEVLNLTYQKLTPSKWHDIDAKLCTEQMIPRGYSDWYEKEYFRKDGTILPVSLRGWLVKDTEGTITGSWAIVHDITDRKKVENALLESEERYRAFFEQAPHSIVLIEAETGDLVEFNERTYENLGYSRPEFEKLKIPDFEIIESAEEVAKHIKKIIREGSDTFETKHRTKGGEVRYILVSSRVISIEGKDYIQSIWSDITDRKRAEEALREAKELFEKTFISQLDAILLLDSKNPPKILDCNPAATEVFGYTRQEMLGRTTAFLHVDETALIKFQKLLYPAVQKHGFFHLPDFRMKRKDGTIVPTENSVVPIKNRQGIRIGWVSVVRNITENKKAEGELERSREQLSNLAAHLQSAREEERRLIAREIHDELGQSLTALKMDLFWLDKRMPADQKPLLKKTKSMSKLIDKTVRRIKKISAELRPGLLDYLGLPAAIEWEREEFQNRTGIKCEVNIDSEDIILDQDRSTALFRIFQEALTNTARHANATRVRVSLKEKAGKLELRARDNGKGIIENQISDPKSFGLIGMRERAQFLGGDIEIRGVQDKGTTIIATIPLPKKGKT